MAAIIRIRSPLRIDAAVHAAAFRLSIGCHDLVTVIRIADLELIPEADRLIGIIKSSALDPSSEIVITYHNIHYDSSLYSLSPRFAPSIAAIANSIAAR